jgi:NOL1/NOP2/fmu family ribosome biogenesis protein
MQNLKILNKKEIKSILESINKQWGCDIKLDYAFLMNQNNRIFLANKELFDIDMKKLRVNSLGLYFGEFSNDELRLTIEGSQLIGPKATKNVLELDDFETKEWLKGTDLDKEIDGKGFFLIKHDEDFMGSGKLKDNKLLNYTPKTRRLAVSD